MAKIKEIEEADYLVLAQLEKRKLSVGEVVMEAFRLEHGCKTKQDISNIFGGHKSLITSIFKYPEDRNDRSIERLISNLHDEGYKQEIIKAWVRARFDVDLTVPLYPNFGTDLVTPTTVRQIKHLLYTNRPQSAGLMATSAFDKTEDEAVQERLLELAFRAYKRSGQLGRAMRAARIISERAHEKGDHAREATGHYLRAQLLRCFLDVKEEELNPVIELVGRLLKMPTGNSERAKDLTIISEFSVVTLRISANLTYFERGLRNVEKPYLLQVLKWLLSGLEKKVSKGQRFYLNFLTARCYLLLNDTFNAQEHLDGALKQGTRKLRFVEEMTGPLEAQILSRTEPVEKVASFLLEITGGLRATGDSFHAYLAEHDLARLESSMFPKVGTL